MEFQEARIGQACGLLVALGFMVAGAWTVSQGHPWEGAVIMGGGVGLQALVATFVKGRGNSDETRLGEAAKKAPPRRRKK